MLEPLLRKGASVTWLPVPSAIPVLADAVAAQRDELENRVARLSSASLDPDLLDERVRAMLNYSRQDEVVIMLPPVNPAASAAAVMAHVI